MRKILISIPDQLVARMRVTIPARRRSKTITHLIEEEVTKREQKLYEAAAAVEKEDSLRRDMEMWNVTLGDGLDNESR